MRIYDVKIEVLVTVKEDCMFKIEFCFSKYHNVQHCTMITGYYHVICKWTNYTPLKFIYNPVRYAS